MDVWRSCVGFLSCIAIAGCGGHSLDIGSNDGGVTTDSEVSTLPLGPSLDAGGVTRQVWVGHLENHQFPDGSDTLTMTLDFAPGGQVTGSLLLGNGAILQPPTDPNVGYPPGNTGAVTLVEGFPYTILDGSLNGSQLSFDFSEYEVWTQWCALQTPYLEDPDSDADPYYECAQAPPKGGAAAFGSTGCGYASADGGITPIDCGKLELCGEGGGSGVCRCTASGCDAFSPTPPGPSLGVDVAKTSAQGTLSGNSGVYQVRFIRIQ
jgi:hypothetical protein